MPTDTEELAFEAGVKFGSLYHQFAGTPVSPDSADSLATAIEEAIENQPYCESVTVDIQTDRLRAAIDDGSAEYTELTGEFMEVDIVLEDGDLTAAASMAMEDGYPLMVLERVE